MVIESCTKKTDSKIKKEKEQNPPSKIVIRKLPPTFTEEEFKESISPLPENNYFKFVSAEKKLGQNAFSRSYINFINVSEIFTFKEKFDGYIFVDQKGNEYPAIVEYAPFQKIPKISTNQKKDLRCGTIDEDPDYLQFLNDLQNPTVESLPTIENLLEEIENIEKETRGSNGVLKVKTPLLEYLEQRNADRIRCGDRKRRKDLERKQAREELRRKRKEGIKEWPVHKREEMREERKKKEEEKQKWKERRKEEKEKWEKRRKEKIEREAQIKKEKCERGKELMKNSQDDDKTSEERLSSLDKKSEEKPSSHDKKSKAKPSITDTKSEEKPSINDTKSEEKPSITDTKSEEKPSITDTKSEEKPSINDTKSEEKPSINDTKSEEKPSINDIKSEEKPSINDTKSEEKPSINDTKSEEKPSINDTKSEEKPSINDIKSEEKPYSHDKNGLEIPFFNDITIEENSSLCDDGAKECQESRFSTKVESGGKGEKDGEMDKELKEKAEDEKTDERVIVKGCEEMEGTDKAHDKNDKEDKDPRMERRIRNKDRPTMQLYRPGQARLKPTKSPDEVSTEKVNVESSSTRSISPVTSFRRREELSRGTYGRTPDTGGSVRKGYSYNYERENKAKWGKGREEGSDSQSYRSVTYRRSNLQE